ncbi:uncharacterized protein LOC113319222 [Papaver somniferum]|uniref:uncharacterized protein LOC113319222 n=1 Tax=Papaver somniferum TaxID=3469 RepID=UPI000E6F8DC0|nr:uncharacterized protein LOC113319222 [Papaver somniferum]
MKAIKQGSNMLVWTKLKLPRLNTTVERVWEEVILTEEIPAPPNLGREPQPGKRSHEFCRYHRFHGHHTNDCRNVRRTILRIIEQGKLAHYVEDHELPSPPQHDYLRIQTKRHQIEINKRMWKSGCNFIAHSKGDIQNFHDNVLSKVYKRDYEGNEIFPVMKRESLKEWKEREISFSAQDPPGEGISHTDSLVITLTISENSREKEGRSDKGNIWAMERVLVDMGSLVDVIFYRAFKALGYEDSDMMPSAYNLYVFNGVATKPKGEICVKIFAGELEMEVTVCVVDVESPYNALMGRPWIRRIKGVASTYHQAIRFPIPSGIGEIKGNLGDAKDCGEKDIENYEERLKRRKERRKSVLESKKEK